MDLESTLGDADATILDGGSQGSVVSVWGANYNTQVSDVTIPNGVAAYNEMETVNTGAVCFAWATNRMLPSRFWMSQPDLRLVG